MEVKKESRAFEVKVLKKHYGNVKAVDGVSFYVKKGQVFTLLGPNGAGKTTIVEILEGLKEADSGDIYFFGEKLEQIGREQKERIGVLLQENNYIERIKVREIIDMFSSFFKKTIPREEILERIVLKEKSDAYIEALSGGQKQRLSIGLALINDPEIVFLDEPTTGLDPQARRNVWELIEDLKEEGKTIFLTTHYMDEAEQLSDFVYIMDQGKIIARGSPRDLISELGRENVIDFEKGQLNEEDIDQLKEMFNTAGSADRHVSIYVEELSSAMSRLLKWADDNGADLDNLMIRRPNLEDVFLELTGKGLRE